MMCFLTDSWDLGHVLPAEKWAEIQTDSWKMAIKLTEIPHPNLILRALSYLRPDPQSSK